MTERVEDERFPEPDESAPRPGETHQEWTDRNRDAEREANKAEPATTSYPKPPKNGE